MKLIPELLSSADFPHSTVGAFGATLQAHGLYNAFQFVLRLSPAVHRKLAEQPLGLTTSAAAGFDRAQAFSTYLHETVHWWQHVGSTHGLMRSLSYPSQAHANYSHLKRLLERAGFRKSVRNLSEHLSDIPAQPGTLSGLANTIINNHFDFGAYRDLTFSQTTAVSVTRDPMFENVGHAYQITYANNVLLLASISDRDFRVLQHPKEWEAPFQALTDKRTLGFYFGSPVQIWPLGAYEILEGQACFIQLQFLAFASGNRLGWDDFRALGMLHGVYERAFSIFLDAVGLTWPPTIDHPTVGLFLLLCDMAINPGAGFPFPIHLHFESFVSDVDPGIRFSTLCTLVRSKLPSAINAIRDYSRQEYEQVTEELAAMFLVESPLAIASTCSAWAEQKQGPFAPLMGEHKTFEYEATNLTVRVLFTHFLAFMHDKFSRPEFFCWPGAWMAGDRVSEQSTVLFDRHSALFVDKEEDDGIFPRLYADRDESAVQTTFDTFYAMNITYDMTDQWIARPGPFTYPYRWLVQSGSDEDMKSFADRTFFSAYGVHPKDVELQ